MYQVYKREQTVAAFRSQFKKALYLAKVFRRSKKQKYNICFSHFLITFRKIGPIKFCSTFEAFFGYESGTSLQPEYITK